MSIYEVLAVAASVALVYVKLIGIESLIRRNKQECDAELLRACGIGLSHMEGDPRFDKSKELAIIYLKDVIKRKGAL